MFKQLSLLAVGLVCLTGWSPPMGRSITMELDAPKPYVRHSAATNIHALWITSFLEARGGGWEAIRAVQFSILNRSHRMHLDIYDTVHKRKHFSCFNKHDPNHKLWLHPFKLEPTGSDHGYSSQGSRQDDLLSSSRT